MSPAQHEQGARSVTLSHRQAVLSSVLSTSQLCLGACTPEGAVWVSPALYEPGVQSALYSALLSCAWGLCMTRGSSRVSTGCRLWWCWLAAAFSCLWWP